jgi:signal transduction histidine kinase
MLYEFLSANKEQVVANCNVLVARQSAVHLSSAAISHGIPIFLEQLINTLRVEQAGDVSESLEISGSGDGGPGTSQIGESAASHGSELLRHGVTVDQVVHTYGNLCQVVTNLAFAKAAPITVDEFRTLNRCLDNAIAAAVTEHQYQLSRKAEERTATELNERLGMLAHELRNHINTASLAMAALKSGYVGVDGATGAALNRALLSLRNLIDRSLADVRVTGGLPPRYQQVWLSELISDITVSASLEADSRGCRLTVAAVDASLAVNADREMLYSAIGNLLTNAFKFTHPDTDVSLRVYASGDRILIEVADHCGGLPPGGPEPLFIPFHQSAENRSGLGLGLAICRRSVEANDGRLTARDLPGVGCIFSIDLPRHVVV